MAKRKALVIGIDEYQDQPLSGCVNDAVAVAKLLSKNEDGTPNFEVVSPKNINYEILLQCIDQLFKGRSTETALLYFAGHGCRIGREGHIVVPNGMSGNRQLPIAKIVKLANESEVKHRIVVLDCCYAGAACEIPEEKSAPCAIRLGTTLLISCRADETAAEKDERGVFSSLFCDALAGGAATLGGQVTPAGAYAYVDRSLGAWDQSPMFATNTSESVVLRKCKPSVSLEVLRLIPELFSKPNAKFPLDPSFEHTNKQDKVQCPIKPYALRKHTCQFRILQQLNHVGLVVPNGTKDMYFAAMENKSCSLTPLGRHYWNLAKRGRL